MNPAAPPPGGSRRFAPRTVALAEFSALVHDSSTLLAAAPARLLGLFLLIFLPTQLVAAWPYAGVALRFGAGQVAFCGFFAALAAVRAGRQATLGDLVRPWQLPADKIVLLVASGLVPLLCGLLVWWADLGWSSVDAFLGGEAPAAGYSVRQDVEFAAVLYLASAPLYFLQPLSVLHAWSATRSLSASLLSFAANWRWVLALTGFAILVDLGLNTVDTGDFAQTLLAMLIVVAVQMVVGAFTLVLLQRSLA